MTDRWHHAKPCRDDQHRWLVIGKGELMRREMCRDCGASQEVLMTSAEAGEAEAERQAERER